MKVFLIIVQIIPALIALAKAIEEALPQSGIGAEKLAAFRKIFEAAFEGAKEIWPVVEKVIAIIIELFNATGVFKKTE